MLCPLRDKSGTDGPGDLGFLGHFDMLPQFSFQRFEDTDIFGHPAGHHNRGDHADAVGHGHHPGGDGFMDTGDDILSFFAFGNQRNNFGFRKYRAQAADL